MSMSFEKATTKSVDVNGIIVFESAKGGVPPVLLYHLTAVLEDWDPGVVGWPGGKAPRDCIR
jgi:hypothetical protein